MLCTLVVQPSSVWTGHDLWTWPLGPGALERFTALKYLITGLGCSCSYCIAEYVLVTAKEARRMLKSFASKVDNPTLQCFVHLLFCCSLRF